MIAVKEINTFNAESLKDSRKELTQKLLKLFDLISDRTVTAKLNIGKPECIDSFEDMSVAIIEANRILGNITAMNNVLDYYDSSN